MNTKNCLLYCTLLASALSSIAQTNGTNITITAQPQSQIVPVGANATFSVTVTGTGPFGYQWQFDGSTLPLSPSNVINTIAGNGTYGFSGDGGPALNAAFQDPWGLVLDASLNLFFLDSWNNRVRKIGTNGIIMTVAGGGTGGLGDGGPATNATLSTADGWGYGCNIALDPSGNILIADTMNNRVRKVSNGIITTMAGNGTGASSGDRGQATNASLNNPTGVAVDALGNVYIAEFSGNRIRKVNTSGVITTVAGTGTAGFSGNGGQATNATLNGPGALAVDTFGNLFIAEIYNNIVREVAANGIITTAAGNGSPYYSGDGIPATNAGVGPVGVTVDGFGRLLVVDNENNRIREVDTNGIISTIVGGGAGGLGDGGAPTNATLNYPGGVALDTLGNLYITDTHNERIRRVAAAPTSPTLTLVNVGTNNAGNYQVVVTNSFQSVTSSVAVLQINSLILVNGHLVGGAVFFTNPPPQVSFLNQFPGGFLFYTLDGSTPTTGSTLYSGAFTLTNTAIVQVLNVNSNDTMSVLSPQVEVGIGTAPRITMSPSNTVLAVGTVLNLTASASGTGPLAYQWYEFMGNAIAGATNATYHVASVALSDSANYWVVVSSPYGSAVSGTAIVTVYGPVTITSQPTNQVVPLRGNATFSVSATGYPTPTYQWMLNSTNLPCATSDVLTVNNVQLTNTGIYQVLASNAYSFEISTQATLSMSPSIVTPFAGAVAIWGRSVDLSVGATGTAPLAYQWFLNGTAITGATNSDFFLSSVQFTNGGLYSVVVSSAFGTVTNAPAQLVVNPAGTSIGMYAGVTLTGTTGYKYIIQYISDLASTNWTTLTNLTLDQPVELWVDTSTNAQTTQHRYYQVLPGQ